MSKRQQLRQERKSRQRDNRTGHSNDQSFSLANTQPRKAGQLTPRNPRQKTYLHQIASNLLTFGLGPAGTGKTFLAAWLAGDAFERGDVRRIIVTRPIVEAGESLGYLPGDVAEKIDPYFVPVKEALEQRFGPGPVAYMLKSGQLMFVPFALMRGRTFDDAFVILDEAQNTTPAQMKMFLTRAGEGSRFVVNGDLLQSDIPGPSGLADAVSRFKGKPHIGMTIFKREDVVRSGLAAMSVEAYEGDDTREQTDLLGKLPDFILNPIASEL